MPKYLPKQFKSNLKVNEA